MEKWIAESITGLDIGPPQSHRNLVVFPLLAEGNPGPEYLTLGEALQDELVTAWTSTKREREASQGEK